MSVTYALLRSIVTAFFRLCTRFEIIGRENLPHGGPLLVAINHIHTLDSPAVMAALPYQITTLAARKWEHHWKGFLLRRAGVIFVNRGQVDRQALHQAIKVLRDGGILGLAPEGTRSHTAQLQAARGGVAYLAHAAQAPILPVAITGVEQILPALKSLRRATVRVVIGQPFSLPALPHRPRAQELLEHADMVMHRIAAMLPKEYRGVYAEGRQILQRTPAPQG